MLWNKLSQDVEAKYNKSFYYLTFSLRVKSLNVISLKFLTSLQSICCSWLQSYQSSIWGGKKNRKNSSQIHSYAGRSQVLNLLLAGDISMPAGPLHSSAHVSTDFLQSKQVEN